jgi:hypothetical protein
MRLSDAALRRRQTNLIYPNHPQPPSLIEAATRDRSSRLLGGIAYKAQTITKPAGTKKPSYELPNRDETHDTTNNYSDRLQRKQHLSYRLPQCGTNPSDNRT